MSSSTLEAIKTTLEAIASMWLALHVIASGAGAILPERWRFTQLCKRWGSDVKGKG